MKYNVNQKVKIALESQHVNQGLSDGIQMEGTIINLNQCSLYQYKITWSNGQTNNYREEDLLPYNTEPNYEIY